MSGLEAAGVLERARQQEPVDGWRYVTVTIGTGETAWAPGSPNHPIAGPAVITYAVHPSGVHASRRDVAGLSDLIRSITEVDRDAAPGPWEIVTEESYDHLNGSQVSYGIKGLEDTYEDADFTVTAREALPTAGAVLEAIADLIGRRVAAAGPAEDPAISVSELHAAITEGLNR